MKSHAGMLVICVALSGLFAGLLLRYSFRHRPETRLEMRDFLSRVQLQDTKAQVRQKFNAGSYKTLNLRENLGSSWSISTPFEFGAGNWLLWMEFERDKLRATRLRIEDGMPHRPREAVPPDKIAPGWPRQFPRN